MESRKLRKEKTSDSSSGSQKKRRRPKEKQRERKKRKEGKRKKRHYSSDSSSSSSDDEERLKKRRLLKEAKRILKSQQKYGNDAHEAAARNEKSSSSAKKVLTEEDYYEKNKEFSAWLKQEHKIYFTNLSGDDARRFFLDFVRAWNSGKLSENLYSGVNSATRSDHKWQFKGGNDFSADREEELEFIKKRERSQRKKFDHEHKELMDELLPKATGREKLLEKRSNRKEEARLREESPELLRDQDIMGGSDDYKQRLERQRAQRERKAMQRTEAFKEKQFSSDQKEAAAMEQFKELMHAAGGKITIPKRIP